MSQIETNRQQAIVMGGSLGGLLTARVLSKHFDRVTIVEKDRVTDRAESRPGQPQTRHLHGLLATGLEIMTDYFPDLPQALVANGAMINDFAGSMRWYVYGGYRARFESGFPIATIGRGLLECLVRERVLALPNIQLVDRATVTELQTTPDRERIVGIIVAQDGSPAQILSADFVVDVTGRGSRSSQWLAALGYEPPPESKVHVDVGYATRMYRRDPLDPRSQTWILNSPEPPQQTSFGAMFPIEGDRWLVSIGGWHRDRSPISESGFLELVRSLPSPDIYDIISQSEPLGEIVPYKFPFSLRRHYERLRRFPTGYLVLGDAISSFNPTYGQGMTVAALAAVELDRLFTAQISPAHLAQTFFQQMGRIIDAPWQLAVGEDFRFPQTTGIKPFGTDFINLYVTQIHRASLRDVVVGAAFLRVMNLIAPPLSLVHPQILWRVLWNACYLFGLSVSKAST
jgi:2-polyprenyl-6-methoxyphenol hydroxylase-like FAD-dependent oxidoreductase